MTQKLQISGPAEWIFKPVQWDISTNVCTRCKL